MAVAPLKNHCIHGIYNGNKINIFLCDEKNDSKTIHEIQNTKCWKCEEEENNRKKIKEQQKLNDINFIKKNLLEALEDENFREEVKKIINL